MVFPPSFHTRSTPRHAALLGLRGRDRQTHEVDPASLCRRRSRSGKWGRRRERRPPVASGCVGCCLPTFGEFCAWFLPRFLDLPAAFSPSSSLALQPEVPFPVPTGRLPLPLSKQLARSRILGCIRPRGRRFWETWKLGSGLSQRNHFRPAANLSADVVRPRELGRRRRKGSNERALRGQASRCVKAHVTNHRRSSGPDLNGPCAGNRLG